MMFYTRLFCRRRIAAALALVFLLEYLDTSVRDARDAESLLDMPVPISTYNFETYGASTTPTLVLLDRTGKVAWYHPGAVMADVLKAEIEKVAR